MKTIQDLPDNVNLKGVLVKALTGEKGYWSFQNDTEVWLSAKRLNGSVVRVPVKNMDDVLKWEVLDD